MLETKEQKQIFAGSVALVIILMLVSFLHRPQFKYQDTTNYKALQAQSDKKQQAYSQYLASLGTTQEAQATLFKQILPESEIRAAVQQKLGAGQKVEIPSVPDSEIKIFSASGKAAVRNYLTAAGPLFEKLQTVTHSTIDDIYNPGGDQSKINSLITNVSSTLSQYQKIPAPKETVVFHKQLIVALGAYLDLLKSSKTYMADPGSDPWPQMYKNYTIITQAAKTADSEFNALDQKYNFLADSGNKDNGNWLVPAARAQLATTDIWQKAQEALNEVAATSIARFMLAFLDELANKIESVYRISNFLYYTDALVSGQYADDYLNKYVNDPLDRVMIKNFIPEVNCGKTADYNQAFEAKADQYLGFDPKALDPKDPNYYQKLARVGNFLSSPEGWQLYYKDVAQQAQVAARSAANHELDSPGQKTARDIAGDIITPVAVSVSALQGIFQRYLSEGRSDQQSTVVEKITSQITQNFLNSFVFKGTVLLEQKVCIPVPLVQLVTRIPLSTP